MALGWFLFLSLLSGICGASAAKADSWNPGAMQVLLHSNLEYDLSQLPLEGQRSISIQRDLWPAALDGLNWRPDPNELSPAEKYALLHGLDVTAFTAAVSRVSGVLSSSRTCDSDQQCDAQLDEICARRRNQSAQEPGRCVSTRKNLQKGFAAWSIKDPAPLQNVERQSPEGKTIVFKPRDIAALQSLLWDLEAQVQALTPMHCHWKTGKPQNSCRDLNPGTYHILLTNYLGLQGKSFVENRTIGDTVWSLPVSGYRILKMEPLLETELLLYKKQNVRQSSSMAVEVEVAYGDYTVRQSYILDLDAKGRITGGKWTHESQGDQESEFPDFIWTPGTPKKSKFVRGLEYGNIRDLLNDALGDDSAGQVENFN